MSADVDDCIRNNLPWTKLPKSMRQLLGNSPKEYEKMIVEFSVKNQLRFKGNLIRHVRKNEEQYYDLLMQHSRTHLMLYPYHLADLVVRELRITPFHYYINMMQELMAQERSYDSLPNFTAADCLRLLGIGRNQYIDLMNQCRSAKKAFRKRPLREILPPNPVPIEVAPWWLILVGNVMEEDVKLCSRNERDLLDMLIDEGGKLAGTMDAGVIQKLYQKGLVYFDVPIQDSDFLMVPPLDGFVMNRVLGDYFETLLYKIFVSIDEQTSVLELSKILQIDLTLVKNALSVFCRLGFTKKKLTGLENMALHVTWATHMRLIGLEEEDLLPTLETPDHDSTPGFESEALDEQATETSSVGEPVEGKRIGFLFDSTLTAFLMMGNLSSSLKTHAVTLFEVGKLSEEALDSFVQELQRVKSFGEGEAQRYFEHAEVLRKTVQFLRETHELDLLRCESLMGLDRQSRLRVLRKNYKLLISMAPLTKEVNPVNCCHPPHLGPPIAEVNSPWFRLFLYELAGEGPVSILVAKGRRLRRLPRPLRRCRRLLLCTWSHDPGLVLADTCLPLVNEALQHSAVFLQSYTEASEDSEVVHLPFPDNAEPSELHSTDKLRLHPAVQGLREKLRLDQSCGYVTLFRNVKESVEETAAAEMGPRSSRDPRKVPSRTFGPNDDFHWEHWTLFDCVFGLPLFDSRLNAEICQRMRQNQLFDTSRQDAIQNVNRRISLLVLDFIQRFQPALERESTTERPVFYPVASLIFESGRVSVWNEN